MRHHFGKVGVNKFIDFLKERCSVFESKYKVLKEEEEKEISKKDKLKSKLLQIRKAFISLKTEHESMVKEILNSLNKFGKTLKNIVIPKNQNVSFLQQLILLE